MQMNCTFIHEAIVFKPEMAADSGADEGNSDLVHDMQWLKRSLVIPPAKRHTTIFSITPPHSKSHLFSYEEVKRNWREIVRERECLHTKWLQLQQTSLSLPHPQNSCESLLLVLT
jgi:hypothetical protein